jgi:hypothetical protein
MCFSNWARGDVINLFIAIGTFLTAGFTLGLIIVANLGFKKLLSQEAGKAQLVLMLDLIDKLAAEKFEISVMKVETNYLGTVFFKKSILEYTSRDLQGLNREEVLLNEGGYDSIAYSYLQKTLLPDTIAVKIKALRDLPKYHCKMTRDTIPKILYYFPGQIPIERITQQEMVVISEGLPEYIKACLNLKAAIRSWLSKHGVSDLNSDFISS